MRLLRRLLWSLLTLLDAQYVKRAAQREVPKLTVRQRRELAHDCERILELLEENPDEASWDGPKGDALAALIRKTDQMGLPRPMLHPSVLKRLEA